MGALHTQDEVVEVWDVVDSLLPFPHVFAQAVGRHRFRIPLVVGRFEQLTDGEPGLLEVVVHRDFEYGHGSLLGCVWLARFPSTAGYRTRGHRLPGRTDKASAFCRWCNTLDFSLKRYCDWRSGPDASSLYPEGAPLYRIAKGNVLFLLPVNLFESVLISLVETIENIVDSS